MSPSTSFQRLYIRTSLRELDLPTDFIVAQHVHLFNAIRLPEPRQGQSVDDALTELTREQADVLCKRLRILEAEL